MDNSLFLRAERRADGVRTFKVLEGEPLRTSYGKDLYNEIFLKMMQPDEMRNGGRAMPDATTAWETGDGSA
jgi:hypothetical protein